MADPSIIFMIPYRCSTRVLNLLLILIFSSSLSILEALLSRNKSCLIFYCSYNYYASNWFWVLSFTFRCSVFLSSSPTLARLLFSEASLRYFPGSWLIFLLRLLDACNGRLNDLLRDDFMVFDSDYLFLDLSAFLALLSPLLLSKGVLGSFLLFILLQ